MNLSTNAPCDSIFSRARTTWTLPLIFAFGLSIEAMQARLCSCLLRLGSRAQIFVKVGIYAGSLMLKDNWIEVESTWLPVTLVRNPSSQGTSEEVVACSLAWAPRLLLTLPGSFRGFYLHKRHDFSLPSQHPLVSSHLRYHQNREFELKMGFLHAYVADSTTAVSNEECRLLRPRDVASRNLLNPRITSILGVWNTGYSNFFRCL